MINDLKAIVIKRNMILSSYLALKEVYVPVITSSEKDLIDAAFDAALADVESYISENQLQVRTS